MSPAAASRIRMSSRSLASVEPVFVAHMNRQGDWATLLNGSCSAFCSTVLLQPLDLLKTRLQTQAGLGASKTRILPLVLELKRNNIFDLWRGTVPSLIRNVPGITLYFYSIEVMRGMVNDKRQIAATEAVVMGITGRTISSLVLFPATLLKTRYECGLFNYSDIRSAIRTIRASEGLRGFYRGVTATLLRDVPYSGMYFMFYTMTTQSAPHPVSPGITFACGLGSGVAASILTQPFDVLKTKMQLRTSSSENIITSSASMLKTGGFKSFFAGTTPRILRRSLMSAFSWTIFDSLLRHDAIKTSK